jgi:hypothetical protein
MTKALNDQDHNLRWYKQQRRNAKRRGIDFLLTYAEWLQVWLSSGHLADRGLGGYVMARHDDRGPYVLENIKIITQRENNLEFFQRKTPEEKQRWSDGLNRGSPEARAKTGAAVRKVRAERHWSCSPKDPVKRAQWIENLRQSQLTILADPVERAKRAANFTKNRKP